MVMSRTEPCVSHKKRNGKKGDFGPYYIALIVTHILRLNIHLAGAVIKAQFEEPFAPKPNMIWRTTKNPKIIERKKKMLQSQRETIWAI